MGVLTARVEAAIRDAIGALAAGDMLPSERQLAAELGAARTTVRLVLSRLTVEGLVSPEHGRGYIVTRRAKRRPTRDRR